MCAGAIKDLPWIALVMLSMLGIGLLIRLVLS